MNRFHLRSKLVIFGCLLVLLIATHAVVVASDLTVMHCWSGAREPLVNQMLEDFTREYGITVTPQLVGCSELTQRFLTMYGGGVAPDIIMLQSDPAVQAGRSGALLPLDAYLRRDGLQDSLWIPSEINNARFDGVTYGLPIRTGSEDQNLFFLNVDHFEQAGLPADRLRDWDRLAEVTRKLVRYDGDNLVRNPIGQLNGRIGNARDEALQWVYANGGQLHSEDLRTIEFASREAVEAAEWLNELLSSLYRSMDDHFGNSASFQGGSLSILVSGVYEIFTVQQSAPHIRFSVSPRPLNGTGPQYRTVHNGTFNYAISSQTSNPDAAWELLKWLTIRKESAGEFMFAQGRPSPILEYNYDARYLDLNPQFPVVIETMLMAETRPILPVSSEILNTFAAAFRQGVRGEAAPGPALQAAAEIAQSVLNSYWAEQSGN